MRFQTIGLLALLIIGMGAVGIYKSDDLSRISNDENSKNTEPVNSKKTVLALAIRNSSNVGTLVSRDSFELFPATFGIEDEAKYVTQSNEELFDQEIFILKNKMEAGEFVSPENLESLKSKNFTDMVLRVDRSSVENFTSDFYNVYWHFNSAGRDKNSRKVKLFSKNVFIRPLDESQEGEQNTTSYNGENGDLSPVVFSVNDRIVERYLQADQLGYFKIVNVTQKRINLENYSTLEVDSSKEIQANDISSSYKYDVNFIK